MVDLEKNTTEIIAAVGEARSCYIEAIGAAKDYDFERAEQLMNEGREAFNYGHHYHMDLMVAESNGEKLDYSILLLHADDLLMSAEAFGIIAQQMIELYHKLQDAGIK